MINILQSRIFVRTKSKETKCNMGIQDIDMIV